MNKISPKFKLVFSGVIAVTVIRLVIDLVVYTICKQQCPQDPIMVTMYHSSLVSGIYATVIASMTIGLFIESVIDDNSR